MKPKDDVGIEPLDHAFIQQCASSFIDLLGGLEDAVHLHRNVATFEKNQGPYQSCDLGIMSAGVALVRDLGRVVDVLRVLNGESVNARSQHDRRPVGGKRRDKPRLGGPLKQRTGNVSFQSLLDLERGLVLLEAELRSLVDVPA